MEREGKQRKAGGGGQYVSCSIQHSAMAVYKCLRKPKHPSHLKLDEIAFGEMPTLESKRDLGFVTDEEEEIVGG